MRKAAKSKDTPIKWGDRMFALTNYGVIHCIAYYRRTVVADGIEMFGEEAFRHYMKAGHLDIRRIEVKDRK